jgi:hypothetical protein
MVNEHGYKQMSLADRAEYEAAIKEYFAMGRRTDPQWYVFASSRDDPSGERDLRGPNGVSGLLPRAYEWLESPMSLAGHLPESRATGVAKTTRGFSIHAFVAYRTTPRESWRTAALLASLKSLQQPRRGASDEKGDPFLRRYNHRRPCLTLGTLAARSTSRPIWTQWERRAGNEAQALRTLAARSTLAIPTCPRAEGGRECYACASGVAGNIDQAKVEHGHSVGKRNSPCSAGWSRHIEDDTDCTCPVSTTAIRRTATGKPVYRQTDGPMHTGWWRGH